MGCLPRDAPPIRQQHSRPQEQVLPFVLYNLDPEDRAHIIQTLPTTVAQELIPIA